MNNEADQDKHNLCKFYTKEEVAKELIKKVEIYSQKFDLVIEPSAGTGAFYNNIKHEKLIGIDIDAKQKMIIRMDWMDYQIDSKYKKVLIIGNPPFGKRNKQSIMFLKHAFSFSNVHTVAFILPNVFRKYTLQKHIPEAFRIEAMSYLEPNSFIYNNKDYHMPTSFFIFSKSKGKDLRQKTDIKSRDFYFSTKNHDFDFFVFGSAPWNIIKYSSRSKINSNNRGYYVKSLIDVDILIARFKHCKWVGHSSVNGGVYWLTKVDIIENYNQQYGGKELNE